jgi:hypothetical protein
VPALPELLADPQPPVFAVVYVCASHSPKTSLCATKFWHSLGACVLLLLKMRKSNLHPVATQRTPQRQEGASGQQQNRAIVARLAFFPRDARLNGCFGVHCLVRDWLPSRDTANAIWVTLPTV